MTTRRQALRTISGGAIAAAASVGARAVNPNPVERPNILWLTSEDHNPWLGAYGDPRARTPNLDALARRGVLYRNAYSNAPVCAPSRFAILTGCHAESCGPAHHMRAVAKLPSAMRTYPEYMRALGYYCTNNEKTDYNCDVDPRRIWDDSSKTAHWKNRPAGSPFMAVFNSMTTHESKLFKPVPGRVSPSEVRVPRYLPDTPAIRGDFAGYYNLIEQMDGEVGARLAELEAAGLAEDTIIFYYSDNGGVLPRSKRYCYDEGLRVALMVYAPPKWRHLIPVAMGTEVTTPVSLVDLAPSLLSLAGIPKPQPMQGSAFLGPHLGKRKRYAFGMRNRMDERYDFVRTATDGRFRYIRNYMPHRIYGVHGDFEWQAKGYQSWDEERLKGTLDPIQHLFFERKPFEELYDLQIDPDQVDNLASRPAHRARMKAFRTALDKHMLAVRDNGFIPEGESGEGYAATRDERAYPLRAIMPLAQAAARGDVRKLTRFSAALRHANPIVRYWAATGLVILEAQASPARDQLLSIASADPSAAVRVAAAEALCTSGDLASGLPLLGEIVGSDLPVWPRLMALNALDGLGERARPALHALKAVADDPNEYIVRAARYQIAVLEGTYSPDITFGRGTTAA